MPHLQRLCLAALFAFLSTACLATKGPSPDPGGTYRGPVSLVALMSKPLSWDKLEGLEYWIATNSTRASNRDLLDARLELADGRSEFGRRDTGQTSAAVLRMRKERAVSDYKLVLSNASASSSQVARAKSGILLAGGSYTGSAGMAGANSNGTLLNIIPRSGWSAAREVPAHMNRHVAPWSNITVHHTAMATSSDSSPAGRAAEMRKIQLSHLNKRSPRWGDVGYHYLIDPEGRIYEGRRLAWRGAHVAGLNDHKIGVSLMGNFEVSTPTTASLKSLERLLDDLRSRNHIPRSGVSHHTAVATAYTECPGRNLIGWVQAYQRGSAFAGIAASAPRPSASAPNRGGVH
jgi:hypothetical protein